MALHNLDPVYHEWELKRIAHSPEATYEIPMLSLFRLRADLKRQFHRKVRQMRGRLENMAIRSIVYHDGYEGLPGYADDMVKTYLSRHGRPVVALPDRPFQAMAIRQINAAQRPDPGLLEPVLLRRL